MFPETPTELPFEPLQKTPYSTVEFRLELPSKGEHYSNNVAVAARMDVLERRNTSVDAVIYGHTIAGAVYCNGATSGVAPHNAAVRPSVKVVVEGVSTDVHETLSLGSAARAKGDGIPDSARAVHVNVARAIKRCIAEHIIAAKVHPCNIKGARMALLRCQRKR